MKEFAGRVAVVTGSGSGIGRATAIRLGSEEANVACVDLDEDAAQKTAARIAEAGGRATAYRCNVAEANEARATVARIGIPRTQWRRR